MLGRGQRLWSPLPLHSASSSQSWGRAGAPHSSQNHRGWRPLQPSKPGASAGSISDLGGCDLLKGRVRWVTELGQGVLALKPEMLEPLLEPPVAPVHLDVAVLQLLLVADDPLLLALPRAAFLLEGIPLLLPTPPLDRKSVV